MKLKALQSFLGQKNERVNEDNSIIPEGTIMHVSDDRGAVLIELGYCKKMSEPDYENKELVPKRKKK